MTIIISTQLLIREYSLYKIPWSFHEKIWEKEASKAAWQLFCNARTSTVPRKVIAVCMLLLINPYNISHDIYSAEVIWKQIIEIMNKPKQKQK